MALGIGAVGGSAVSAFNPADAARLSVLTAGVNPKVRPRNDHLALKQCYRASPHRVKLIFCLTVHDNGVSLLLYKPYNNSTMCAFVTLPVSNGRCQTDILSDY